jgi:hypothetical protein
VILTALVKGCQNALSISKEYLNAGFEVLCRYSWRKTDLWKWMKEHTRHLCQNFFPYAIDICKVAVDFKNGIELWDIVGFVMGFLDQ